MQELEERLSQSLMERDLLEEQVKSMKEDLENFRCQTKIVSSLSISSSESVDLIFIFLISLDINLCHRSSHHARDCHPDRLLSHRCYRDWYD